MLHVYELESFLEGGGMGEVYLATDTNLKRRVAVKVLPPDLCSGEHLQRFLREARKCADIKDRNVVQIHYLDNCVVDGRNVHYFVMEYVEGENLQKLVGKQGRLHWREALDYILEAAKGLEAVHNHNLIHRDIKPGNIMLSKDEHRQRRVVLMDFGLVREQTGTDITLFGRTPGTPSYMSPEQCRAEELDHRSDIYSLGATLYCLLTGRKPFEGPPEQVLIRVGSGEAPVPVRTLVPELPAEVAALVEKAMAQRREDRFATIAEMADEIRRIQRFLEPPQGADESTVELKKHPEDETNPGWEPIGIGPDELVLEPTPAKGIWIAAGVVVAMVLCALAIWVVLVLLQSPSSVTSGTLGKNGKPQPPLTGPPSGMVRIEAGYARLGNSSESLKAHFATVPELAGDPRKLQQALELALEEPQERVFVPTFYIDPFEVTNDEYAKFVEATHRAVPLNWKDNRPPKGQEKHPVRGVSHRDATAYAEWAGKKLPTLKQWMRAYRGDSDSLFPWGNTFDSTRANTRENPVFPSTSPVDATPGDVSCFGVYNLVGNVCELLRDPVKRHGETAYVIKGAHYLERGAVHGLGCVQGYVVDAGVPGPAPVGFRCVWEEPAREEAKK